MSALMMPFLGGILIGIAVSVLMLFNGRICGNSGIVAALLKRPVPSEYWRYFYVAGLLLGGLFYRFWGAPLTLTIEADAAMIVAAGLLVGYGTRLGGGCTSGHGICGMARFSKRSIAATVVFMVVAIATHLLVKFLRGM